MRVSNPKLLLQLSDIHFLPKVRRSAHWQDTEETFRLLGAWIKSLSTNIDAIVITGDLVDDGRQESYEQLKMLLVMFDCPVYVIPGNHDDRANLQKICSDYILSDPSDEYIQYTVDVAGMQLVLLDTVQTGENYGILCNKRLQWLSDTLRRKPDTPTIVAMHHPPFKTGFRFMDKSRLLYGAEQLEEIIFSHPQVKRLICGHQHRPCVQSFGNTIATVAPSTSHQLTAQFYENSPLGYTWEPPSVVVHLWNEDEGYISSHLLGVAESLNKMLFSEES